MMSKSVGQIVGTLAGAVIGAFIPGGYIALGASIGGMVGGLIDPPKGPKIEGPRLSDTSQQTASYGVVIPRVYGTCAIHGNIFWIENNALREVQKNETQGGKGGGGQEVTSYTYLGTFALGLCDGPIGGVRRIWASGKLIYDASASDIGSILNRSNGAGQQSGTNWTLFNGAADQAPSSRMEATLGVGNVPGYRGLAYILFEDFDLTDYGNSLLGLQLKVEIVPDVVETWAHLDSVRSDMSYCVGLTSDPTQYHLAAATDASSGDFQKLFNETVTSSSPYAYSIVSPEVWPASYGVGSPVFSFFKAGDGTKLCLPPYVGTDAEDYTANDDSMVTLPSTVNAKRFVGKRDNFYFVSYQESATLKGTLCKVSGNAVVASVVTDYAYGEFFFSDEIFSFYYSYPDCTFKIYDDDLTLVETVVITLSTGIDTQNKPLAWKIGRQVYLVEGANKTDIRLGVFDLDAETHTYTSLSVSLSGFWDQSVTFVGFQAYSSDLMLLAGSSGSGFVGGLNSFGVAYWGKTWPAVSTPIPLSEIVETECLKSGLLVAGDIDVTALTQGVRGYRVANVSAIRSALEPLQSAWPFEVVQSGYKIKFSPRGSASVATIGDAELGAAAPGENEVVRFTESREMDTQLPREVSITYLDYSREYDLSEQKEQRVNTDAVNVLRTELPIVLSADEAAEIAQQTLYRLWLERVDVTFSLPPIYWHLEPGDIVTLNMSSATRRVRLVSLEYLPDGRVEATAKLDDAAVYAPAAVGAAPPYVGQVWPAQLVGPTRINLLDLPCLSDATNAPGSLVALCGYTDAWAGANLYRSSDLGSTWGLVGGFRYPVTMGMTTTALGDGRWDIFDVKNTVNVNLYSNTLSSVTMQAVLNGENHFAIGADGRWEIVGAANATLELDGTYTLSTLLRGRLGTEWAMGTHQVGDQVIWLNDTDLSFVTASLNDISLLRDYKAIGYGNTLDDGSSSLLEYSYQGVNLTPLAPRFVKGWLDTSGNWNINWVRRTRIGWVWRDHVDAAVGESFEKYETDIYAESGKTVRLATIESTTPSIVLSPAQQTAIFGGAMQNIYGDIYQISASVGRGRKSEFSLIGTDPNWALVSLALHFNGSNGQTTIADEKGAIFSRYGTQAQLSTSQVKFGTTSAYRNNTASYWYTADRAAYQFGTGDFSISGFVYLAATQTHSLIYKGAASGSVIDWELSVVGSSQLRFTCYNASSVSQTLTTAESIPLNTWVFVEFVRSGTNGMAFIAGVKSATTATISNDIRVTASAELQVLGKGAISNANGYFDEFKVAKYATHTASYTPPTQEFPNG